MVASKGVDSLKGQQKREQLIEAAASGIAKKGSNSLRLRDVAARCSVTTGMLQHYFETRDELVLAAFEHGALKYVDRWRGALPNDPSSEFEIRVLVDQLSAEFSDSESSALWIDLCAQASRDESLRGLVRHVYGEWRELLVDVISRSTEHERRAQRLPLGASVNLIIAVFDGLELSLAAGAGSIDAPEASRLVADLVTVLFPEAIHALP